MSNNLKYWIEEDSEDNIIWIKIPSVPEGVTRLVLRKEEGYEPEIDEICPFYDDFEDNLNQWSFSGDADWYIGDVSVYTGDNSAHSGSITHNEITRMTANFTPTQQSTLKFHWRASSESSYDFLLYAVDNTDVTRTSGYDGRRSGNTSWEQRTHNLTEIKQYSITFAYAKDFSVSTHNDQGYVDNLYVVPIDKEGDTSITTSTDEGVCTVDIENDTENELTDYVIGVNGSDLDGVETNESIEITTRAPHIVFWKKSLFTVYDFMTLEAVDVKPFSMNLLANVGNFTYPYTEGLVYFKYRKTGEIDWIQTTKQFVTETGVVEQVIDDLDSLTEYEYYAIMEDTSENLLFEGELLSTTTTITQLSIDLWANNIEFDKSELFVKLGENNFTGASLFFSYKQTEETSWKTTKTKNISGLGPHSIIVRHLLPQTSYEFKATIFFGSNAFESGVETFETTEEPERFEKPVPVVERQNVVRRPGFIFMPEQHYAISYRVIVNEKDGTQTDLTEYTKSFNVRKQVGELQSGDITLPNPDGMFLDKWVGGEIIDIYVDYGLETPTNRLFSGKIEDIGHSFSGGRYTMTLNCIQLPELRDQKIITQFDNALITDAINHVVETYFGDLLSFDLGQLTTDVRYTGNFSNVDGITVLNRLANAGKYDLFIDSEYNVHLFKKGSRESYDDYLSVETNILSVTGFGKPISEIRNNVTVYGASDSNIISITNKQDLENQDELWRKDLVITDNELKQLEQLKQRAEIELFNHINIDGMGTFQTLGLPRVRPGDSIRASVPLCGIEGFVNLRELTFSFSDTGFTSSLSVKKDTNNLVKLLKQRIDAEDRLRVYENLNAMTDSIVLDFKRDAPYYSYTGLVRRDGVLRLIDGETQGILMTEPFVVPNGNISSCEIRIQTNYPNHELSNFRASNDGGVNWVNVSPGVYTEFPTLGNSVRFAIDVRGNEEYNPAFNKVCFLYKKEYD